MIFTWTLGTLAALIALGACIIYWDKIKEWAQNAFLNYGPKLRKAFANIYYKAGKLWKKIFGVNTDGKPVIVEPTDPPQILSLEELRRAYERGELTKEQYEALVREMSTQVAELSK